MQKIAIEELTRNSERTSILPHSREFEFLSLCARTSLDSETREKIRVYLELGIDWEFLVASAHQHRVLPLVYRTLASHFADRIPQGAINHLRCGFYANAKRNLFLTAELLQIIDLFQAQEISVIPYKGPVLALTVYGEVSLRQFSDLDVIVRRTDVEKAKNLLISRGYKIKDDISNEGFAAFMEREKHLVLLREDGAVCLELHWAISTLQSPVHVSPDALWRNLKTFSIGGREVTIHNPEHSLLILCIHGAKHQWEHLGWVCDIAEILRSHKPLDWASLFDKATALHAERILFLGLMLSSTLLGTELPDSVVEKINGDPVVNELAEQVTGWLTEDHSVAAGDLEHYFVKLRERSADRVRVAVNQIKHHLKPTARDREFLSLHGPLSAAVYLVRPFRLVCEYGLGPFWRVFKGMFDSGSKRNELRKARLD